MIYRILSKNSNILQLVEVTSGITTYAVSIVASIVYSRLLKEASSELLFKNKILDYVGLLLLTVAFVILIYHLLSFNNWIQYTSFGVAFLGCIGTFIFWFKSNPAESFGTGALGE
jgi:hypothetical protein